MPHRRRKRPGLPPSRVAAVALATIARGGATAASPSEGDDGTGAPLRLVTTYDGGRRTYSGAMFDVKAKRPLVVVGLEVNADLPIDGAASVEVWTKAGTYRGSEGDRGAWTLWSNRTIAGRESGAPTPVVNVKKVRPLVLPAKERRAFYVSFPGGRHLKLGSPGDVGSRNYADDNLVLNGEGSAKKAVGSFGGGFLAPHLFSGAVVYRYEEGATALAPQQAPANNGGKLDRPNNSRPRPNEEGATGLAPQQAPANNGGKLDRPDNSRPRPNAATPTGDLKTFAASFRGRKYKEDDISFAGQMFDVQARSKDDIEIASLAFITHETEYITVTLYTKEGTYRGFDKKTSGWTRLTRVTILGQGLESPTFIPEGAFDPVVVRRGHRRAFYVAADGPHLRAARGSNEGAQSDVDARVIIYEGAGKDGRDTIAPRRWDGALRYRVVDLPTLAPTTLPPTHRPTTPRPTRQPTPQPIAGEFRLRMYWERGYDWQEMPDTEFWWCMECRDNCVEGDSIYVAWCNNYIQQRFLFVGDTLRPASDPSLCVTVTGFSEAKPLRVYPCDDAVDDQGFEGLREEGRFEIHPTGKGAGRCVSQMHHPRPRERVYPEECRKTRDQDTTYWVIF